MCRLSEKIKKTIRNIIWLKSVRVGQGMEKKHHVSKKGKLFQDPVSGEIFRVFEWFEHSPGIIRAVRKEKVQDE